MKKAGLMIKVLPICLGILLLLAAAGQATTYEANEITSGVYFGTLSQQNNSTSVNVPWETSPVTMYGVFGGRGCPPTTVANTLVYLESKYPTIYGDSLVPGWQPNPTQDASIKESNRIALVKTALTLGDPNGGPNYLNWNSSEGMTGNTLYQGTENYINDLFPNQTNYASSNRPTWQYLYNALQNNEALIIHWIEVADNSNKHYMTVTGMSWNDATNTGTISYVDPKDGHMYTDINLWKDSISGNLLLSYYNPTHDWTSGTVDVQVNWAMDMAPVPEPATLLLLGLGLIGVAGIRRRFRSN